jgi:hypothetical protein
MELFVGGVKRDTDQLPKWARDFIATLQREVKARDEQIVLLKDDCPETNVWLDLDLGGRRKIYIPEDPIHFKVRDDEIQVRISAVGKDKMVLQIMSEHGAIHAVPWASNMLNIFSAPL